jgi:hypothetical protein
MVDILINENRALIFTNLSAFHNIKSVNTNYIFFAFCKHAALLSFSTQNTWMFIIG